MPLDMNLKILKSLASRPLLAPSLATRAARSTDPLAAAPLRFMALAMKVMSRRIDNVPMTSIQKKKPPGYLVKRGEVSELAVGGGVGVGAGVV